MNTQDLTGKLAVITGGSSGIGLGIAEALAKQGARILIVARNEKKLAVAAEQLSASSREPIETLSADISKLNDVKAIAARVAELAPCADILVNNAGIVSAGYLVDTPLDEWERLYSLNVRGLVGLLQQLTPAMEAQGLKDQQARHIINIASAAGMFSMPSTSAYGATKAAVISLGGSLRLELMAAKVGVTTVCPVYVKTPIEDTVQLFGRMDNPRGRKLVAKSFQTTSVTADDVAREALKAINSNKGLVIVGSEGKFLNLIQRLSRGLLEKLIVKATINKFKYFRAVK